MRTKPDLSFWKLWNLSFGFFGVQIAYALQSANVSRIFTTIGADPHDLSYFWILPPLMGLIVQPIVGMLSDKTWTKLGRRLPYLVVGALVAVVVMCLLPNAGSFNFTVSSAILFGLVSLMMLDTSINMAMQPFKMLVGDMVNEKQKGLAYSIQSFLCNAGSVVGYIFPILFMWFGIKNTAPAGVVPDTVIWSFYIGAAILLLCVVYSLIKIKEWPPKLYNEYNGIVENAAKKEKTDVITLLKHAPSTFWTVGVVQFFCWFAFLFLWTYATNTVAHNAFSTPETVNYPGITYQGKNYTGKYLIADNDSIIINHGTKTGDYLANQTQPFTLTTADIVEKRADGTLDISATGSVKIDNPSECSYMSRTVLDATSTQYNEAGNGVGYSPPFPQPQVLLHAQPAARCGRILHDGIRHRSLRPLRRVRAYRLRLGRYARMAVHNPHQLAARRKHRRLPRPLQLHDLRAPDCGGHRGRLDPHHAQLTRRTRS